MITKDKLVEVGNTMWYRYYMIVKNIIHPNAADILKQCLRKAVISHLTSYDYSTIFKQIHITQKSHAGTEPDFFMISPKSPHTTFDVAAILLQQRQEGKNRAVEALKYQYDYQWVENPLSSTFLDSIKNINF